MIEWQNRYKIDQSGTKRRDRRKKITNSQNVNVSFFLAHIRRSHMLRGLYQDTSQSKAYFRNYYIDPWWSIEIDTIYSFIYNLSALQRSSKPLCTVLNNLNALYWSYTVTLFHFIYLLNEYDFFTFHFHFSFSFSQKYHSFARFTSLWCLSMKTDRPWFNWPKNPSGSWFLISKISLPHDFSDWLVGINKKPLWIPKLNTDLGLYLTFLVFSAIRSSLWLRCTK